MDKPTYYEIRVKGHLASDWADWFSGLTITNLENGEAFISGYLPDQAGLYGVLNRISSLGLTLVSVNAVSEEDRKKKRGLDDEWRYPIPHDIS